MSDLDADRLRDALGDCTIGREIVVLAETSSTNDAVLQMTTADTAEGLVVFAEHQTAGRGQRGNRWESAPHKGLWFSLLLRPRIDVDQSARLTTWVAETAAHTIDEQFSIVARVKPPNDVQIDGRKVAGVLVEMRAQEKAPHIAIAGIGVNVNHAAEDFPPELRTRAISLALALERQVDREKFAAALLRDLDRTYNASFGL
jgi:BirA family transcriptional regulator, biotin operon repressor / biotin---[acetyl-CoA-carboxylase] ligase